MCFRLSPNVELALEIYELVRKTRAETVQGSASITRKTLHLDDGPEQEARDKKIRGAGESGKNPDLWADNSF